jgi:hypothetical protein
VAEFTRQFAGLRLCCTGVAAVLLPRCTPLSTGPLHPSCVHLLSDRAGSTRAPTSKNQSGMKSGILGQARPSQRASRPRTHGPTRRASEPSGWGGADSAFAAITKKYSHAGFCDRPSPLWRGQPKVLGPRFRDRTTFGGREARASGKLGQQAARHGHATDFGGALEVLAEPRELISSGLDLARALRETTADVGGAKLHPP